MLPSELPTESSRLCHELRALAGVMRREGHEREVLHLACVMVGLVRLPSYRCEFGQHPCDDADLDEDGNCPMCALVAADEAADHDYTENRLQEMGGA
jgi:hypothetical protein